MSEEKIERFFCNVCNGRTKHFIRGEYNKHDDEIFWYKQRMLIIECCGCENLELVKMTLFSEDIEYFDDPHTGEPDSEGKWEEAIYRPVTYRIHHHGSKTYLTTLCGKFQWKSINRSKPAHIIWPPLVHEL